MTLTRAEYRALKAAEKGPLIVDGPKAQMLRELWARGLLRRSADTLDGRLVVRISLKGAKALDEDDAEHRARAERLVIVAGLGLGLAIFIIPIAIAVIAKIWRL